MATSPLSVSLHPKVTPPPPLPSPKREAFHIGLFGTKGHTGKHRFIIFNYRTGLAAFLPVPFPFRGQQQPGVHQSV